MFRTLAKATAAIAVVCTVAGAGLVLDEEYATADSDTEDTLAAASGGASFTGSRKIRIDGPVAPPPYRPWAVASPATAQGLCRSAFRPPPACLARSSQSHRFTSVYSVTPGG
ncbi:hypothetical protein ACIGO6_17705 [Streptomyces sp. NPDC053750]|uniref:hypothetical protein n=1 Tax=Streptomyces sp. NPDC053750 TaxID=3365714 RepID=UPI0037D86907